MPAAPAATPAPLHLVLPASIEALPAAQARLAAYLAAAGLGARIAGRAELLLEELVTNAIRHGGLAGTDATMSLHAAIAPPGGCRLTFEDPGPPFDPSAASPPEPATRLEEARIGGLGLVLLHRMARDLVYERLPEGRNRIAFSLTA